MAQYITRIRTEAGDLQIDYNALANLPPEMNLDKTLTVPGYAADAQVVGDMLDEKADITYVDEQFEMAGSPYNYLVNSDFTKFIAQTGLGVTHSNQAITFAGDRWRLDNGTITGDSNTYGGSYSNIVLNGTISQTIAENFEEGSVTCGVEVLSGTATATYDYDKHQMSITSNGGILKSAWLYKGNFKNTPTYQPKGYTVELAECQRYFQVVRNGYGYISENKDKANVFVHSTLWKTPSYDKNEILVEKNGDVITAGQKIAATGFSEIERYLPYEFRIKLDGSYPEPYTASTLFNARILLDVSLENDSITL